MSSPSSSSPPTKANEAEEYESDPEDAPLPSMRRREAASDDEDNTAGDRPDSFPPRKKIVASDAESDCAGAPEDYDQNDGNDDHDNNVVEGEEYYDDIDEEELIGDEDEGEIGEEEEEGIEGEEAAHAGASPEVSGEAVAHDDGEGNGEEDKEHGDKRGEEVESKEKKENEPFAVPTAGAFYMHDDRFRDNARRRGRRFPTGRKLWESKDDQAWVHDRFEELNIQDSRRDERRSSRGRFRGRGGGKARGPGQGYARGNRSRAYDDNNNLNHTQRSVRGRGPRRYETLHKNRNEVPATSNKQYLKHQETHSSSGNNGWASGQLKQPSDVPDVQPKQAPLRKPAFSSSLNSASPPFYPSGSSNQDISATQKKDGNVGITNRLHSSAVHTEENMPAPGGLHKGRWSYDSAGHDRLYGDEKFRPVGGKAFSSSLLQAPVLSLPSFNAQSSLRMSARGVAVSGPLGYQPSVPLNQVPRTSSHALSGAAQPRPFQSPVQPLVRTSAQPTSNFHGNSSQAAAQVLSTNLSEVGEGESPTGSSKLKTTSVGKGQVTGQGAGKGPFFYGGPQMIGATGSMPLNPGDQGFPGAAALLPVMQIGGQHGVPMGVSVQGYVAQPQLGFGNSEGTWVPLLASAAAGALGQSIPYITLDGNYYPRPSGQTSSASSSRETILAKPSSTVQPPSKSEIVNDDIGHRQNKPRRYSEMNFGQ